MEEYNFLRVSNPEDSDENFNIGSEVNVVNFYKQVKVGGRQVLERMIFTC